MIQFISDNDHYSSVLERAMGAKRSLWIGTADIKDLYVVQGKVEKPFLGVLSELIGRGVEVRLIHAKEPGQNFREDFDRYPRLAKQLERAMCYVGSANLTGAGMGMKSATRRNFEAGILTDAPEIVNAAIEEFDKVWRGSECKKCQRRHLCPDPIA